MSKKTAFVFPGQGSQSVGMLNACAQMFPQVIETFSEASDALGYDLWQLVQNGPAETLNQTSHTQPALLVASIALWRIWNAQGGLRPVVLAGHSLGEYSALVCAEALDFASAVKLVAERGQFMQDAVPAGLGAMAAIVGLDDDEIRKICEQAAQGQLVTPANYNAIGQIVVAGHNEAVERVINLAKQAGAKLAMLLPVSVPSHCGLMQPAAERLANRLNSITFTTPKIPVINNVDVAVRTEPSIIKDALVRQLANPVRWVETVQQMSNQGIETFIECGSGKILAGLNKRIVASVPTFSIADPQILQQALGNT